MTRKFFFHFNKPASKQAGFPLMTIHYDGQCILVRSIICHVPTVTRERKVQPRMVVAGQGVVRIARNTEGHNVATITEE